MKSSFFSQEAEERKKADGVCVCVCFFFFFWRFVLLRSDIYIYIYTAVSRGATHEKKRNKSAKKKKPYKHTHTKKKKRGIESQFVSKERNRWSIITNSFKKEIAERKTMQEEPIKQNSNNNDSKEVPFCFVCSLRNSLDV